MRSPISCGSSTMCVRKRLTGHCKRRGWCWTTSMLSSTSCAATCASATIWKRSGVMRRGSRRGGSQRKAPNPKPQAPKKSHIPNHALRLRRGFACGFDHVVEEFAKILKAWRGNDDRVPTPADIFRDAEKAATGIFLESEDKSFSFDLNLVRFQSFFVYRRSRLAIRPSAIRR